MFYMTIKTSYRYALNIELTQKYISKMIRKVTKATGVL